MRTGLLKTKYIKSNIVQLRNSITPVTTNKTGRKKKIECVSLNKLIEIIVHKYRRASDDTRSVSGTLKIRLTLLVCALHIYFNYS